MSDIHLWLDITEGLWNLAVFSLRFEFLIK